MMRRCANGLVRLDVGLQALGRRRSPALRCFLFAAFGLIAAALLLYKLDEPEICGGNEAVEALVVQQMVEHGEILFPSLNAQLPMYKPPLFHWTATAAARLLGARDVTEGIVRLPSALYALAGLLLTVLFVTGWLGLADALLAGMLLLASSQYVAQGRFGRVDMTLTLCETLALFSFLWWMTTGQGEVGESPSSVHRRAAAHYLFAAALGLGVLAKGPVGMLLPIIAVTVFLVSERRWSDARALLKPGPVILLVGLACAWYLACLLQGHVEILDRQIGSENFGRFFGVGYGSMSLWYYAWPLLVASLPLGLLAPLAVAAALRGPADQRARVALPTRLLAIFWCATVIFFSLAAYKRRAYLLPLVPASAVLVVGWLRAQSGRQQRSTRGAVIAACGAVMLFNPLYLRMTEDAACRNAPRRRAAAAIDSAMKQAGVLYFSGIGFEAMSPLLFYLDREVQALPGNLENVPSGYVLVAADTWRTDRDSAALHAVLSVAAGPHRLTLLEKSAAARRGRVIDAANGGRRRGD